MIHVTDHHIDQRTGADGVPASRAAPIHCCLAHVLYGKNVGAPQILELARKVMQWGAIEISRADKILLLEARKWRRVAARDAQQPVGKDAFDIDEMTDHLLDGPFTGSRFETCLWFLRRDFTFGFNTMSRCMIFNSLQYLSNRPLVLQRKVARG